MSHTIHTPLSARVWAVVATLLIAFGLAVTTASPAHAHDELIGSDPASGASVDALPAQLTLTFSAEIADDEGASVVEVTDASGTALVDGSPSVDDNVLTQPLVGEAAGDITVLWKVVSSDGHPISGEFTFSVAGGSAPTETGDPQPSETAEPAETPEPTATPSVTGAPADEDSTFADAWPWIIGGLLLAGAGGALVYALLARARRQDEQPRDATEGATAPESEPPAEH